MKRLRLLKSATIIFFAVFFISVLSIGSALAYDPDFSGLSAPKGLKVTVSSTSQLNLTWSSVKGAASYQVYRSTGSSSSYTKIASVKSPKYKNTGLKSGTKYNYKIRAVKGSRKSGYSSVKSAYTKPGTPGGLNAAASGTDIKLTWSAVTRAASYKIYASRDGGVYTYAATVRAPALSYTHSGLSAGSYSYKVSALSGATEGAQSAATAAIGIAPPPPPSPPEPSPQPSLLPAPGNFSAATYNFQSVQLTYDVVQNAAVYRIYYSTVPSENLADYSSFDFGGKDCRVVGLTAGTVYYFRVAAVDAQGTVGSPTGFVPASTAVSPGQPSQPAFYLNGIDQVGSSYRMKFYRSANPVYQEINEPSFKLYVGSASTNMAYDSTCGMNQYFYYDAVPGQSLWYGFTANYGPYESTMQKINVAALGKPTGVSANGVNQGGKVYMNWSAVYAADKYNIYYCVGGPAPGMSWMDFKASAGTNLHYKTTVTGTSAILTGIPLGTTYYFFVVPANSVNVEGWYCGYAISGVVF